MTEIMDMKTGIVAGSPGEMCQSLSDEVMKLRAEVKKLKQEIAELKYDNAVEVEKYKGALKVTQRGVLDYHKDLGWHANYSLETIEKQIEEVLK